MVVGVGAAASWDVGWWVQWVVLPCFQSVAAWWTWLLLPLTVQPRYLAGNMMRWSAEAAFSTSTGPTWSGRSPKNFWMTRDWR